MKDGYCCKDRCFQSILSFLYTSFRDAFVCACVCVMCDCAACAKVVRGKLSDIFPTSFHASTVRPCTQRQISHKRLLIRFF